MLQNYAQSSWSLPAPATEQKYWGCEHRLKWENNPWNADYRALLRFSIYRSTPESSGNIAAGYVGLGTRYDRGGNVVGKAAIFQIFGASYAEGASSAAAVTEEALAAWRCILAFPWKANVTYRVIVRADPVDSVGRWWNAWLRDESNNNEHWIGRIRVPTAWQYLHTPLVARTEYYGAGYGSCTAFVRAQVLHNPPTANAGAINTTGVRNDSSVVPPGASGTCTNIVLTSVAPGVRHDMANTGVAPPVEPGAATPGSYVPPPPAGVPVAGVSRSDIQAYVVDQAGNWISELEEATVEETVWERNNPGSAQITFDPEARSAVQVQLRKREIQIWIEEKLRWWGRPMRLEGDASKLTLHCEGLASYWNYRYVLNYSLDYENIDQIAIAGDLVVQSQLGDNRFLNIMVAAYSPSGVPRYRRYRRDEHPNYLRMLTEFTTLQNGFDWDIAFDDNGQSGRWFQPYYPRKGTYNKKVKLEWKRNVENYRYLEDVTDQATIVWATGGTEGDVKFENYYEDWAKSAEYGRLEAIVSQGNQKDVAWLLDKARSEVEARKDPLILPELICTENAGKIIGVVFTGDIVDINVVHGRVNMVGQFVIVKLRRMIDGKIGVTTVPIQQSVRIQTPDIAEAVNELAERIEDLEQIITSPSTFEGIPTFDVPPVEGEIITVGPDGDPTSFPPTEFPGGFGGAGGVIWSQEGQVAPGRSGRIYFSQYTTISWLAIALDEWPGGGADEVSVSFLKNGSHFRTLEVGVSGAVFEALDPPVDFNEQTDWLNIVVNSAPVGALRLTAFAN